MRWLLLAICCGCGFTRHDPLPAPRLLSPLSTAFVSSPSPPLRFALPPTVQNPVLDVCRTRACDGAVIHGAIDMGTATPDQALTPGTWYWRVRADTPMGPSVSHTWQLRIVPQVGSGVAVWGSSLDVDGDGFDELAVGTPHANTTDISDGKVYVYGGGPDGPDPMRVIELDAPAGGAFGFALAAVDFNGDGFADLAVGAPEEGMSGSSPGAVYIYYGGPSGLSARFDVKLAADGTGALGWALDSAGDFDGDGFGDLIAGAPTSGSGVRIIGGAWLFNGAADGNHRMTQLVPEAHNLTKLGVAVAGGGDLDGDGLDDVVIAATGGGTGGHAWVIRGGANGGTPLLLDENAPMNAQYGYSLVMRGDVDGDGLCDLAVGEPEDGPGHVHLYQGVPGMAPMHVGQLDGPDGDLSRFGASLAGGDTDGDGRPELAIAALCAPAAPTTCDGRVYLWNGSALGVVATGPHDSYYGSGLVLPDSDGDGKAEVVVGTGHYQNMLGRADWYRGGAGTPTRAFLGSDPGGDFGYVLR